MADKYEQQYIYDLQQCLRRLSYKFNDVSYIVENGSFDNETKQAVTDFQRIFGLAQTGEVDKMTFDKIYEEYDKMLAENRRPMKIDFFVKSDKVLKRGDSGDDVMALQIMQNAVADKFDAMEKGNPDGIYRRWNEKNALVLQEVSGIEKTGKTDKKTWDTLVICYDIIAK